MQVEVIICFRETKTSPFIPFIVQYNAWYRECRRFSAQPKLFNSIPLFSALCIPGPMAAFAFP